MEEILDQLSSKDSRTRGLALESLINSAKDVAFDDISLGTVMRSLTECLGDNNIKVSLAACDAVSALADSCSDILGDIFSSFGDAMAFALADLFGNAKVNVRDRAMEAANSLMGVLGPEPVAGPILNNSKLLAHKNWRVKEGILKLYTAQVLAFHGAAVTPSDELIHCCANALVDALPEMRRAATDVFASMGVQRGGDLGRVLSILNTVAERRGIAVKPSHVAAIRERFEFFSAAVPGAASGSAGGGDTSAVDDPAWDTSGAASGGGGGAAYLGSTSGSQNSNGTGGGSGGGGYASSAPSSASKLKLKVPGPDTSGASSTGPASLASSHGSTGFSGGALGAGGGNRSRAATASSAGGGGAGSGGGGWGSASQQGPMTSPVATVSFGVAHSASWDDVASDPAVTQLCQLHTSPHWKFAVLGGFTPVEVGTVKPVELGSPRDLVRLIDGVIAACSTTTSEWADRSKALDRVRALVAGGKKNPCIAMEGFAQQIARLRDCLCTQVQELRSTLAKQACLVVVELSAALSEAGLGWIFEPCAEPLTETLIKLTAVSIAVISSSADAAIKSIIHNAAKTGGYARMLPKLTAGCRSKSGVTRAHAANYLLAALRGWPKSCLDKHADELCNTALGLIRDADPNARQAGRHAFWSLASLYPSRAEGMVGKLDPKVQRSLYSEEARRAAIESTCEYLCSPMVILTEAPSSYFNAGYGFAPTPSASAAEAYHGFGSAGRPQTSLPTGGPSSSSSSSASSSSAASTPKASSASSAGGGQAAATGFGVGGSSGMGIAQKEKPQTAGARVPTTQQPQQQSASAAATPVQAGGHQRLSTATSVASSSGFAPSTASSSGSAYRHYYSDDLQDNNNNANNSSNAHGGPSATTLPPATAPTGYSRGGLPPSSSAIAAAANAAASGGMSGGAVRVPVGGTAVAAAGANSAVNTSAGSQSNASTARSDVASARSVLSYTAGTNPPLQQGKQGQGFSSGASLATSSASSSYASSTPAAGFSSGGANPAASPSPSTLSSSVLASLVSRARMVAKGSPRASELYAASAGTTSSSGGHPLRMALAQLLSTLVTSGAVDSRSVCRIYAERLPEQIAAVVPEEVRAEFCVAGPATQPLLSDGQIDAHAALVLASQLQQQHGPEDGSSAAAAAPIVSLITACLKHGHEYVQLDGLALLFTLLDACVDVGGPLSDALNDVMMNNNDPSASSSESARPPSGFAPEAVAVDHSTAVRLFTVKVTTQAGASNAAVATPSSAAALQGGANGTAVVTIMPVFARLILQQQQQPGQSPTAAGSSGAGVSLPASFVDILHLVIALSSVGGSDAVRLASRRVISALRRAYTIQVLLAGAIACMSRPLSLAAATAMTTGVSSGSNGEEDTGAITARTHAAALMLTLSLLGDAGACEYLFSHGQSLTRLLSRAAAMASAPAPTHLLASSSSSSAAANAAALASSQKMGGYVEGILRLLAQSSPAKVATALQNLKPEERSLLLKLASNADLDIKALSPTPSTAVQSTGAAAVPTAPVISFGGSNSNSSTRPSTAAAATSSSGTAGSSTPIASASAPVATRPFTAAAATTTSTSAATLQTPAASAAPAAPSTPGAALPFPVSKSNLELIRDSLLSGDLERVTRALHYLGRQVDLSPSTATSSAGAAGGTNFLPTLLAPVPFPHNEDPAYLAVVERVMAGVLTVVEHAAGLKATNIGGGGAGGAPPPASASAVTSPNATFNLLAENGTGTVDAVLLSTALSVIRKLYRNAPAYMLPSCGPTYLTLISACRYANREQSVVLERTMDEVAEKMPVDVTLLHLVGAIAGSPCAVPELSAVCIASFRALTRCVPRIPAHYLLNECAKGRLMTAAVDGFNSPSTEVRRSVVQLLASLSISLRSHFTRYVDAYLTVPQSKLLTIYVEKALAQQAGGGGTSGGSSGGGALSGLTPAK